MKASERRVRHVPKICFDRLCGLTLSAAFLPLGLLVATAIAIEALFHGERPHVLVSERRLSAGRPFALLKFRVFELDALRAHLAKPDPPSLKALEAAGSVTRVGKWVKAYYLDELPQLWNVAVGQMSLVGPRPYYEGDWRKEPRLNIPARRLLKAGLAGPFQAVKGGVKGLDQVNVLDTEYLELLRTSSSGRVLLEDFKILWRSGRTALRGKGL